MLAANAYDIQMHLDARDPALFRLSGLDSARPLDVPALVAHDHGDPVAALSLVDGRSIADPFRSTGAALTTLRLRADGLRAVDRTPSLRERLLSALPFRRARMRAA